MIFWFLYCLAALGMFHFERILFEETGVDTKLLYTLWGVASDLDKWLYLVIAPIFWPFAALFSLIWWLAALIRRRWFPVKDVA